MTGGVTGPSPYLPPDYTPPSGPETPEEDTTQIPGADTGAEVDEPVIASTAGPSTLSTIAEALASPPSVPSMDVINAVASAQSRADGLVQDLDWTNNDPGFQNLSPQDMVNLLKKDDPSALEKQVNSLINTVTNSPDWGTGPNGEPSKQQLLSTLKDLHSKLAGLKSRVDTLRNRLQDVINKYGSAALWFVQTFDPNEFKQAVAQLKIIRTTFHQVDATLSSSKSALLDFPQPAPPPAIVSELSDVEGAISSALSKSDQADPNSVSSMNRELVGQTTDPRELLRKVDALIDDLNNSPSWVVQPGMISKEALLQNLKDTAGALGAVCDSLNSLYDQSLTPNDWDLGSVQSVFSDYQSALGQISTVLSSCVTELSSS